MSGCSTEKGLAAVTSLWLNSGVKTLLILSLCALVLSGCDDSHARGKVDKSLQGAVRDVLCATSHEDLVMAVGAVALASQDYPKGEAEQQAIEFAGEIKPTDCSQAAR